MKKNRGFTLIELLIVIAIIGILAGILLPALGSVQRKGYIAEVKVTINQLSQALKAYETDEGDFPPNKCGNTDGSGKDYEYYDSCLVPFLDGDVNTKVKCNKDNHYYGNGKIQYFEFKEEYIDGNTYKDRFGSKFWYHNFLEDIREHPTDENYLKKVIDNNKPYHPWYNRIKFKTFQIYSKVDYNWEDDDTYGGAYGDDSPSKDTFQWVTNYSD